MKKFQLNEGASTIEGMWVDASLLLEEGEGRGKHHRMGQEFLVEDDHATPTFTHEDVAKWFKV